MSRIDSESGDQDAVCLRWAVSLRTVCASVPAARRGMTFPAATMRSKRRADPTSQGPVRASGWPVRPAGAEPSPSEHFLFAYTDAGSCSPVRR